MAHGLPIAAAIERTVQNLWWIVRESPRWDLSFQWMITMDRLTLLRAVCIDLGETALYEDLGTLMSIAQHHAETARTTT